MTAADHQTLRTLDGRYVLERLTTDAPQTDVLATVHGPAAHPPEATGMLAAIVAPLAAGGVPVWTAASYDGDLLLVPRDRFADATELLRDAGHAVH